MPILATWLVSLLASITTWLSTYVGKKAAVGSATAAVMVAGWVGLQVAAYAAWTALSYATPPYVSGFLKTFWALAPTNLVPCVTAVVAVRLGAWLWRQQRAWFETVAAA